jgi:hypothetical protein
VCTQGTSPRSKRKDMSLNADSVKVLVHRAKRMKISYPLRETERPI